MEKERERGKKRIKRLKKKKGKKENRRESVHILLYIYCFVCCGYIYIYIYISTRYTEDNQTPILLSPHAFSTKHNLHSLEIKSMTASNCRVQYIVSFCCIFVVVFLFWLDIYFQLLPICCERRRAAIFRIMRTFISGLWLM